MAQSKFHVLHFIVCPRVTVNWAGPENPYTLHDVNYPYPVIGEREFPIIEPELWIYVRLFGGRGQHELSVRVVWLESPDRPAETAIYVFPPLTSLALGK